MGKHMNVLHDVMEAWHALDIEGVIQHLHEDFVWNNSGGMMRTINGKDAMRAVLTRMAGQISENRWRLFDYAELGDTLWMEGVDEFVESDGTRLAVPYAGILEFKDGLILRWREYFNAYVQTSQREKKTVSADVEAMLDRPVVTRAD